MSDTRNDLIREALDAGFIITNESKNRTVFEKGTVRFSIPRGHGKSFDTAVANSIKRYIKKGARQ